MLGTISHNKAGWTLNKGAIQGVSTAQKTVTGVANDKTVPFRVQQILPDYTILVPDPSMANRPDPNTDYKAHIPGLMAQTIRVGFALEDVSRQDRATLLNQILQKTEGQIKLVDEADENPAPATPPKRPKQPKNRPITWCGGAKGSTTSRTLSAPPTPTMATRIARWPCPSR